MTATILDFSIDGINASTKHFTAYRIIKPLIPQPDLKVIEIAKRDGVIPSSKNFKQYFLTIKGLVEGKDPDDLIKNLEDLAGWLYSDDDRQLIFSNQPDRYYNVQYLDSPEILRDGDTSFVDLIFTCNDPFGYAITEDTNNTDITIPDTTYLVTNGGHYYARPVITITFNQPQTHIYVQSNNIVGNRFDISKSFLTNDELEIDCKNETVKLNGNFSPSGFGDGGMSKAEFLLLNTGLNELQVGTDDDTLNISISLRWRKVYLY